MADAEEKAHLLSILQRHGQSFLSSFGAIDDGSKKRKAACYTHDGSRTKKSRKDTSNESEDAEEWYGIGGQEGFGEVDDDNDDDDDDDENSEYEHTDDEFTNSRTENNVVVFSDPNAKKMTTVNHVSKAQMKAFMSSKISKVSSNSLNAAAVKEKKEEEEEDRTNAQNDATLHKLVHTKLLSGSLTTQLELTPAQRRKALAGRVMELTGEAKLGKGERLVRDAEKRKAAKRVREGLANKQKERNLQELEEAKNLGNYHPTLKKVFEASASTSAPRKREKGLKMGVGKFSNGALRLGREDVNIALGNFGSLSSTRGGRDRGGGIGTGTGTGNFGKRR